MYPLGKVERKRVSSSFIHIQDTLYRILFFLSIEFSLFLPLRAFRDSLDLAERARREVLDRYAAARGLADKMLCIDLVECLKITDVGEEAGRLHDVLHARARLGEHGLEVLAALLGLRRDADGDNLADRRLDGNLAREINHVTCGHCLAVRPDRCWCLVRVEYLHDEKSSFNC